MAFVHNMEGSSAADYQYRDNFTLFFNTTQERDCDNGSTNPPECYEATISG
jgi:hypothetical protein